jgi:hypothetical protein
VIHRQKGKRELERKARNGGRKSCTDIFKRMLFISTSCESRFTNVTLPEVYQHPVYELWTIVCCWVCVCSR